MEYVDVYLDRERIGRVAMRDDVLDTRLLPRDPRWEASPSSECDHAHPVLAFAYRRSRDEHWPVSFCEACLEVLAGRDPFARLVRRPRWKYDEKNLRFAKWAREWPKRGRPVRERAPEAVAAWPDAA